MKPRRTLGTNWAFGRPKPERVDGIYFPSKSEARRYRSLKLLERGGAIRNLQVHRRFPLIVNGQKIGRGSIEIDFSYDERDNLELWYEILEDHKPVMTREARQRLDVFEASTHKKVRISQ